MRSIYQTLVLTGVSLLAALFSMTNLYAYRGSEYTSASAVPAGSAVALDASGKIELASGGTTTFIGIVATAEKNKVTVADSGIVDAYVSDIDGPISKGTHLGLSAYSGILTAWQSGRQFVGIVQDTSKGTIEWQKASIKRPAKGANETIKVAKVSIRLTDATSGTTNETNIFSESMSRIAYAITGHQVALWRIVTAFIVGGGSLLLAACLLISTGRGSFISIGRNPLASATIVKGMWRIVFASAAIMFVGTFIAYMILRSEAL